MSWLLRRVLGAVLALSTALQTTALAQPAPQQRHPSVASPPSGDLPNTGTVDDCEITITDANYQRDWMPIVSHPGPDGGSPLWTTVRFHVQSRASRAVPLRFSGWVFPQSGAAPQALTWMIRREGGLDPVSRAPSPSVSIVPNQALDLEMLSFDGPYVPLPNTVHAALRVRGSADSVLWLGAPPRAIGASS